ncbi:MAG: hypothetical protein HY719_04140, partial [Planctomycetes bacterium]|nr:hypothetical protein [Planctomycetota bacterium]
MGRGGRFIAFVVVALAVAGIAVIALALLAEADRAAARAHARAAIRLGAPVGAGRNADDALSPDSDGETRATTADAPAPEQAPTTVGANPGARQAGAAGQPVAGVDAAGVPA